MLQRLVKRIRCTLTGHPLRITHLELLNGTLYPTCETCVCGANVTLLSMAGMFKDRLHQHWMDEYARFPTDYPRLFGEDVH